MTLTLTYYQSDSDMSDLGFNHRYLLKVINKINLKNNVLFLPDTQY